MYGVIEKCRIDGVAIREVVQRDVRAEYMRNNIQRIHMPDRQSYAQDSKSGSILEVISKEHGKRIGSEGEGEGDER